MSLVDRRFAPPGCLCSACALECLSTFRHHGCPAPCSAPHQGCGWQRVDGTPRVALLLLPATLLHSSSNLAEKVSHTKGSWEYEPQVYRCESLISSRDLHEVHSNYLLPDHTHQAVDNSGSCQLCLVFTTRVSTRVSRSSARAGRFASECIFDFSG